MNVCVVQEKSPRVKDVISEKSYLSNPPDEFFLFRFICFHFCRLLPFHMPCKHIWWWWCECSFWRSTEINIGHAKSYEWISKENSYHHVIRKYLIWILVHIFGLLIDSWEVEIIQFFVFLYLMMMYHETIDKYSTICAAIQSIYYEKPLKVW